MRLPYSTSYFWEEAPFFRLLLPLIAGILCYDTHLITTSAFLLMPVAAMVSLASLIICYFVNIENTSLHIAKALAINVFVFCVAWSCCSWQDARNDIHWFGNHLYAKAFAARVLQPPQERDRTWKVELEIRKAFTDTAINDVSGNTIAYFYKNDKPLSIHQGDEIIIPNKFTPIKNSGNPFEFDYTTFARHRNIFYQQFFAISDAQIIAGRTNRPGIIQAIHNYSMNMLELHVKDKSTLGLLQAMLLGDEINFDDELRQLYVDTGIIHVVAISGGHVMFLFFIVHGCFFWMRKKEKYQWVIYLTALPIVWLYVFVAGAPTSAVRSVVMFSLLALGFFMGKKGTSLNQLFATAFILLLIQPYWLFAVGFQLSFLAVLSLVVFYKPIYLLWVPEYDIVRKLWSAAAMSISAELLIAPLVVFYFHSFPAGFIAANILSWLMMSSVMSGGLIIIVFGKIPLIAKLVSIIVSALVAVFNFLLRYIQLINPVSFRYLHMDGWGLAIVYAIIGALAVFFMMKYKPAFFFAGLMLIVLLSLFCRDEWQALHNEKLVVYNIGRANHIELIRGKYNIVITPVNDSTRKKIAFATKEAHVYWSAWQQEEQKYFSEIMEIGSRRALVLNEPLLPDSISNFPADYVIINYPLKHFTGKELRHTFPCRKIIIGSNQKRYVAEKWKDSCAKYQIPLHATMLDGAFVLE